MDPDTAIRFQPGGGSDVENRGDLREELQALVFENKRNSDRPADARSIIAVFDELYSATYTGTRHQLDELRQAARLDKRANHVAFCRDFEAHSVQIAKWISKPSRRGTEKIPILPLKSSHPLNHSAVGLI